MVDDLQRQLYNLPDTGPLLDKCLPMASTLAPLAFTRVIGLDSMVLHHPEDSSEALPLLTDSTLIPCLIMQAPRQDSCLGPCSPPSHLRNHTIEATLPRLVHTVLHHPGSRTSPLPRPLHSSRTDRRICLPGPLDRYPLGLEEVVGGEIIGRPPAHPTAMEG